jgi:hypothetical protein
MAASAADIARLRRMTNELTTAVYDDSLMADYLEAWPLVDKNGLTIENGESWIEAYDLHAAAADIWEEKAAKAYDKHDFSADGANYSADQIHANAQTQAKHHRAQQKAKVKRMTPVRTSTYYPSYVNPIFDEDENPDWVDSVI